MLKRLLAAAAIGCSLYLGIAATLTLWPGPGHSAQALAMQAALERGEITKQHVYDAIKDRGGPSFDQEYSFDDWEVKARDGTELRAQYFRAQSTTMILLLHGGSSNSLAYNRTAGLLRDATGAQVLTMDLRGHGRSGGARWHTDHVGQFEQDVADVVADLRKENANARIILAGHSMGGGVALRFAELTDAPSVDGYLLFAPMLGLRSPTMRTDPPTPKDGVVYVSFRLPRFIGLMMFNAVGIKALNDLRVLFINIAPELVAYSFSGYLSGAPANYQQALEAVDKPLLIVVGSEDEPFQADQFERVVRAHCRPGKTVVVQGATHNSIHTDEAAIAAIRDWIVKL
jgi:alpha-beta hydrolase superfamily lysophospholipase